MAQHRTDRPPRRRRTPDEPSAVRTPALTDDAFTRFFEALTEGVYIGLIGRDDTATLSANRHLREIFGWAGTTPDADVRPFAPERFVDELARAEFIAELRRNGVVEARLLRLRRVDNSAIWVEVTARVDPLAESETMRVEAIMRDVTERRKREDQARDLQHQLSQAEKLAALGQTMSGVAHELNNPLATILACAERLTVRDLDQATRRDLGAIHNAAERAARIVRNLQTFARKRHTTRTSVDLNQVIRDAVVVEVEDDGPGIPVELQAKIFDPFFTTKPVGKGTGLGLTVAYAIAEEHGGELGFTSEQGRGTCFTLALPATGSRVKLQEAKPSEPALTVPRGTRALVIEDENALGEAVAAALSDAGFRVDRAGDGQEGLARINERHYDLIICDLKMPRIDGMTFFRTVAPRMPNVARRLIFVTGDVAGTEAERFLQESGCRWIPKPFRLRDLVRVAIETLG